MKFKEIENLIENFGVNHPTFWGCALAGEAGEVANILKKYERDGFLDNYKLAEELADVFIYVVLTARVHHINLQDAILRKLEVVAKRRAAKK